MAQNKVTIESFERRMKDRDKKIQAFEQKIIELQEETLHRMKSEQQQYASDTSELEHKVEQFKMRVDELEVIVDQQRNQLRNVSNESNLEINNLQTQLEATLNLSQKEPEQATKFRAENQKLSIQISQLKQELKEMAGLSEQIDQEAVIDPKQESQRLKNLLREQILRGNDLESQLVDIKIKWADLDLENDMLNQKLQQRNEGLRKYSSQVTRLECELVQTKQTLGDVRNELNAVEMGDEESKKVENVAMFYDPENQKSDESNETL